MLEKFGWEFLQDCLVVVLKSLEFRKTWNKETYKTRIGRKSNMIFSRLSDYHDRHYNLYSILLYFCAYFYNKQNNSWSLKIWNLKVNCLLLKLNRKLRKMFPSSRGKSNAQPSDLRWDALTIELPGLRWHFIYIC